MKRFLILMILTCLALPGWAMGEKEAPGSSASKPAWQRFPAEAGPKDKLISPELLAVEKMEDGSPFVNVADSGVEVACDPRESKPVFSGVKHKYYAEQITTAKMGKLLYTRSLLDPLSKTIGASTLVRKPVFDMLLEAQKKFVEMGLSLLLIDGYRTKAVQEGRFKIRKNTFAKLSEVKLEGKALFDKAATFTCPTTTFDGKRENCAPHCTGGAADVLLVDLKTGQLVDFGMTFLESRKGSRKSETFGPEISDEARTNRQTLHGVMTGVGFINYDGEFWHFSYGDALWALKTGRKSTRFWNTEKAVVVSK